MAEQNPHDLPMQASQGPRPATNSGNVAKPASNTITSDRKSISNLSSLEERAAYMRTLLETLQGLDMNTDGRISSAELANDDIKKYLAYRERIDRPGANTDPLKEFRDELTTALDPNAKPAQVEVARHNVVQVLVGIGAHNPDDLRDAIKTAATLTNVPRDKRAEERASDLAASAEEREVNKREVLGEIDQAARKQGLSGTPAELKRGIDQAYANPPGSSGAVSGATERYNTMVATFKAAGAYTPAIDAQLRENLGLPPQNAQANEAQKLQQEIATLGKQLAQYNPATVENAPTEKQLLDVVKQASPAAGHGKR